MALLGGLGLLHRSSRSTQFWSLWFLALLGPVLGIIPFGIWVADRYLYIPAIGMFVLWSRLFFWLWERCAPIWRRWAWESAMGAVLIAFAWHTHHHLPLWRGDLVLWEATTQTCQTSAYCHANLGLSLLQEGKTERGVKELIRAVEIRAAPRYLIDLGDAYTLSARDYRQAVIAYKMAFESRGPYLTAEFYAKMARAYVLEGELDKAARAIQTGLQINRGEPTLWVINSFLQWKRGDWEEARQSLRRALVMTGQTSNAAGFIYHYWGDPAEVGRLLADLRSLPADKR